LPSLDVPDEGIDTGHVALVVKAQTAENCVKFIVAQRLDHNMLTGLAALGYVDGQNILLEFRFANHAIERMPTLAAELVAAQPDLLYTFSSAGARAAAAASSTIPIVVAPVAEETMAVLVSDFARPSGNITGLTLTSRDQREKCLQLLKEAAPGITRIGVLLNPLNPVWQTYPDVLAQASQALGVTLVRVEARGEAELDQAFAVMAAQHVEGLFGLSDSTLVGNMQAVKRIVELISEYRLPSVSEVTDFARRGGLLSLGPDFSTIGRGSADYIDRILHGAKVAELPVVLPSKLILTVNVTIPPSILLRADEVIE
jgi:putative tryptophan/tyrosine transport system substrate-binding protein